MNADLVSVPAKLAHHFVMLNIHVIIYTNIQFYDYA